MCKKILPLIFSFFTLISDMHGNQTDYITYDWLIENAIETGYGDHLPHWRRFFKTTKVRGFLECGIGFSTQYFLEHAEKVVSIEYVTPGYGDAVYQQFHSLFYDNTNWIPLLYNKDLRSNSFNNACAYQCSMHQDYAQIDAAYLRELFQHFKTVIKKAESENYPIDAAFVHSGVYIRGDFVKLLLAHKIPVIVAHGTSLDNGTDEDKNLYGWNKVTTPSNYVKIYLPFGQGTTFWISQSLPEVIASIQEYKDSMMELMAIGYGISFEDLATIADERP